MYRWAIPGPVRRAWLRIKAGWRHRPYGRIHLAFDRTELRVRYRTVDRLREWDRTLRWAEVTRITAFLVDCWTVDEIRMAPEVAGEPAHEMQVSEEAEGFDALAHALPNLLPGALDWDSWWSEVAFPPLEGHSVVLFEGERRRRLERFTPA